MNFTDAEIDLLCERFFCKEDYTIGIDLASGADTSVESCYKIEDGKTKLVSYRVLRPAKHAPADTVTAERHDVTPGYAPMDVEVKRWRCSCGEDFADEKELQEHLDSEM